MINNVRRTAFVAISLCVLSVLYFAWAGGETGTFTGLGPHRGVHGTVDGESEYVYAGTLDFELSDGGTTLPTFCIDLQHHVQPGDTFITSDEVMPCSVLWLLTNYPPRRSGYTPWPDTPDALSDINKEMAARQIAVWYHSDNFAPNDQTAQDIRNRAWEIINAVPNDPCQANQPAIRITPASVVNPIGATQTFTVTVTQGSQLVSGQAVTITADHGTPTPSTVTTNEEGEATFSLSYGTADTTSHITATSQMSLPVGTIFNGTDPNKQKLVLGEESLGLAQTYASATWIGTGSVTAFSFDDYNMDGEHDSGEPSLEGWTITLQKNQSGTWVNYATPQTTNGDGIVHFTNVSAGEYRVIETLQSGWYATTSLTKTFDLPQGGSHSVAFGQIKLPVIIGHVYQDEDLDATHDEGEPPLVDWELRLYRENGSEVVGKQGFTDGGGTVIFSSDPDRDPPDIIAGTYFVEETLQSGWHATTGISQTITVSSGDIGHAWLGNIQPPSISLDKSVAPASRPEASGPFTFTLSIINESAQAITITDLTDDYPLSDDCTSLLGTPLGSDQTTTCQYTVAFDDAGLYENTAAVTVEDERGYEAGDTDSETVTVTDVASSIQVTKSAEHETVTEPGEAVRFSLTIQNTSPTDTVEVGSLIDDVHGDLTEADDTTCLAPQPLEPGETYTCAFTAFVGGNAGDTETDTVTASGTDDDGNTVSDESNPVTITVTDAAPTVNLEKTASVHEMEEPGGTVTFTLSIENTSAEAVTITQLADTYPLSEQCLALEGAGLNVGQSVSCQYTTQFLNAGSYDNSAEVTVEDDEGNQETDGDSATITIIDNKPQVAIEKVASQRSLAAPGGSVTFTLSIENVGSEAFTITQLVDTYSLSAECQALVGTSLAPDDSTACQYALPFTDVGDYANTAEIAVVDDEGSQDIASDTATVSVISIDVEKAASATTVHSGDLVTYTYQVSNPGPLGLESVVVSDDKCNTPVPVGGDDNGDGRLGGAEVWTYTCTQAIAEEITNTATVEGTDEHGTVVSAQDTAFVDVITPEIQVELTISPDEPVHAGLPFNLTYLVTNEGDTPLYDVEVLSDNGTPDEPQDDHVVCAIDELAPEEGKTCIETASAPEDRTYTATAHGHDVLSGFVESHDSDTVEIIENPDDNPGEENTDTDGDGVPDYLDDDADGDGIPDAEEGDGDTDGDGIPDYLDADADNDGIPDAIEGADDADGDGIPNYLDDDSDGDGIPDAIEGTADADGDGIPNFLDDDSDGDGIPDVVEGTDDADGDGIPNYLDDDSDGDGIPDAIEGADDADGDGIPNYLDDDSDGDGIPDAIEGAEDTDADGTPNFLDLDSDDDGLLDEQEWYGGPDDKPIVGTEKNSQIDIDEDGIPDYMDNDADNDGIPNYLDDDADNDGIPDGEEGTDDADNDGTPDWLDPGRSDAPGNFKIYLPLVVNAF